MRIFDQSQYERPTRKWVCGWASEGHPCSIGPDSRGGCIATYECSPVRKDGRWYCTRSNAYEGKCGEGPLPDGTCNHAILKCNPVPSQRARRGALSSWLFWSSFGILLFLLLSPLKAVVISPGELAAPHKFLNQKCSTCHSAFESGALGWLSAAWFDKDHPNDSGKCQTCHVLGENGQKAHGMAPPRLAEISKGKEKKGRDDTLVSRVAHKLNLNEGLTPQASLACASCHSEHRGGKVSLKEMTGQRCQTCHSAVFQKFEKDHPDFSAYPSNRRTRLIFDHNTHLNKHFKESAEAVDLAPDTCRSCHALDPSGRFMTVSSFESACAACHEPQILGKGRAGYLGIPFISVPGLDTETLNRAKVNIGHWPKDSEVEDIPPFIHLLLMADPDYSEILGEIKNLDLLDLSRAGKNQIKAVGKLAWAIKRLLYELSTDGQQGLRRRLEAAIGRTLSESELSKLTAQIPVDLIRSVQKDWFPGLDSEIGLMEKGKIAKGKKKPPRKKKSGKHAGERTRQEDPGNKTPAESASIVGGWYRQDFTLFYRPSGHKDRFLRGWLDLTGAGQFASSGGERPEIFKSLSKRESPGKCVKCHSIDKEGEGSFRVNWSPRQPTLDVRGFSRFRHGPHFSLLDEKGCKTCHKMAKDADYSAGYNDFDPETFLSNFEGIPKALCAECHTQARASNNCLTCHNYHIGRVKPAVKEPAF